MRNCLKQGTVVYMNHESITVEGQDNHIVISKADIPYDILNFLKIGDKIYFNNGCVYGIKCSLSSFTSSQST